MQQQWYKHGGGGRQLQLVVGGAHEVDACAWNVEDDIVLDGRLRGDRLEVEARLLLDVANLHLHSRWRAVR